MTPPKMRRPVLMDTILAIGNAGDKRNGKEVHIIKSKFPQNKGTSARATRPSDGFVLDTKKKV